MWIPAISTIVLSFTDWNGLAAVSDIRFIGLRNYWEIFTVFESDFFDAAINNGVLVVFLFLGPTAVGILLAYLLDKNLRGGVIYQSIFYMPVVLSLAVVGFIWKSVMYSPSQGVFSTVLGRTDPGNQIDWLGDQTPSDQHRRLRRLQELRRHPHRHRVAPRRLHHGALPRRPEERRPVAARGGVDRRLHRVAGVPPRDLPGDEADQHRRRRDHGIEALRAFDIVFALKSPAGWSCCRSSSPTT